MQRIWRAIGWSATAAEKVGETQDMPVTQVKPEPEETINKRKPIAKTSLDERKAIAKAYYDKVLRRRTESDAENKAKQEATMQAAAIVQAQAEAKTESDAELKTQVVLATIKEEVEEEVKAKDETRAKVEASGLFEASRPSPLSEEEQVAKKAILKKSSTFSEAEQTIALPVVDRKHFLEQYDISHGKGTRNRPILSSGIFKAEAEVNQEKARHAAANPDTGSSARKFELVNRRIEYLRSPALKAEVAARLSHRKDSSTQTSEPEPAPALKVR